MFKIISEINNFFGKKILLRVDFNVPIKKGKITDDFRIKKSLPTINYLREKGAKIILVSHIENEETPSLKPVFEYLLKTGLKISFVEDFTKKDGEKVLESMKNGDIVLLENIRIFEGEKKNDLMFAKKLSSLAEIYVNDSFSVSHRSHASIVGVPKFLPSYAGLLFEDEVKNLLLALKPPHPFIFILGGAKFETKIPLIEKFLKIADKIFVGGALANDLFKAKGSAVGKSLVSGTHIDFSNIISNNKIILPGDLTVKTKNGQVIKNINEVGDEDIIVDVGSKTISNFSKLIEDAKFILWNGPLGLYEDGFKKGTLGLAKVIADSDATSIIGGGDTTAAIAELKNEDKFSFISTGGGAMLDFLANETLPGIKALE